MSTQVQWRRGNTTQTAVFTGAEAEVTVNTTNKSVVVHDGITAGGFEAARADLVNIDNATFKAKAEEAGVEGGGGGALSAAVSGITQSNPGVVTTTAPHEFSDGQQVTFTDVGGMTQLNGNAYFCNILTGTTFSLYTDAGLTTPLNTTSFGAYTSGGNVVATTAPGAPTTATYVVITTNPVLTNERVLTAGAGITLSDGGAGGGATLAINLANTVPSNLGSATAGAANTVSRSDHVHAMPTAMDVGAVPTTRAVIAGNGLSGGGTLASNVTISLNAGLGNLNNVTLGNVVNGDALVFNSATSQWENTQNLPRITTQSSNANVGSPNIVKTLNFTGAAVTSNQVVLTADTDPTKVNISIPEIFTQERVEDIVGNMVSGSTQTGISVTYDDPAGKINFATNNFTIALSGDIQGSATVTNLGNVTISTQIAANAVALGTDTAGDYVATLTPAAGNTILLTNTAGTSESAAYSIALNTSSTDYIESVQDIVGGVFDLNTGTRGITAVYDDAAGKTVLSANPFTITLSGDLTGTATVANLGNITLDAQISGNSVALGTDTTGNYVQQVTVSGSGISVNPATPSEGTNVQITIASSSTNAPNNLVIRDANGSFSSNVITASLTGAASLNVLKAGDTMTGPLVLSGAPTTNLQAATKQYVDSAVASASFSLNTAAGNGAGSLQNGDTLTIAGGPGITTSLSGDTFTITNNGVTSISAGSGISLSAATGAITISATGTVAGVSSINSQSGAVTIQGTSGEIDVDQPSSGVVRIGIPNSVSLVAVTASSMSTGSFAATGAATISGNVTGGNLITTGSATVSSIIKTGANAVGNIGSTTNVFDTVFAKATSAQYADLAEKYLADAEYAPGTVVSFGGEHEVTISNIDADPAVAGVVSTSPAYEMNSGLEGEFVCKVAMTGRVPCKVVGPVRKGSLMVATANGHARAEESPKPGTIIGKALENFNGSSGIIEVVVGRF